MAYIPVSDKLAAVFEQASPEEQEKALFRMKLSLWGAQSGDAEADLFSKIDEFGRKACHGACIKTPSKTS